MAAALSVHTLLARPDVATWRARQVVLISIDTLRADRLGTYGYKAQPTSPNVDALAQQSVVFDRAYAAAPWTIPSLAAVQTGRYPVEVGAYTNADTLTENAITLAELFHQKGVATAMFSTHAVLVSERGGFRQGFDTVVPEHLVPLVAGEHKASFAASEPALMAWLEAHAKDPFFVWIHDMSPHLPKTDGNPWLTTPGWGRYDAEVRNSDDLIGRVLRKLAELRIGNDLLVIVVADHGEAFGDEHGLTGHQDVMYDEVLRVPLLIGAPVFEPRRVAEPVELVDLYPTVAALAGLPVPPEVRGESLVPLLAGTRDARSHPYAFHMRFFFENDDSTHWLAVRDGEWKLLAKTPDHGHDGPPGWDLGDRKTYFELYRTADDPGEQHDLFESHPEQVARLRHVFEEWTTSLAAKPARVEADDATREHLRALGYE
ncbi:MAG TPA: sulfatase [Candidatus Dormibacteraeota bacterium]|nr:sulfatase [Candidatus Dormibacteraeota bacterium]